MHNKKISSERTVKTLLVSFKYLIIYRKDRWHDWLYSPFCFSLFLFHDIKMIIPIISITTVWYMYMSLTKFLGSIKDLIDLT